MTGRLGKAMRGRILFLGLTPLLGAFAALTYLGDSDRQVENVDDLAGLGRAHPWVAAAMSVFMFSLTGLPPFAGFWANCKATS